MSAPAVVLGDRSPAAWIGADSEDLPLVEAWREATGASAASLGRLFPDLAGARAGDWTVRDAALLVVARAALDMERAGIGPLMEVIQDNLKTVSSNAALTSSWLAGVNAAQAFEGLGDVAGTLVDAQRAARLVVPERNTVWPGFAGLVASSGVERMAALGLLGGIRAYEGLGGDAARPLVDALRGLDFTTVGESIASSLRFLQGPWLDLPFAQLALAVDTSLVGSIGSVLDAYQGLVEPFGRESAAWTAWLPLHPGALELTPEADHVWTSAAAHVLTRTAIAASVSNEAEGDVDRDRVDQAIEAARRLQFDLDLPLPGTAHRLRDVLQRYAPVALEAFEGAITALAARNPDAARHVGISLREGVKAISKVVAPGLSPDSPPAQRWRSAVGVAISDPLQGRMLIAQIDVLESIGEETRGAVHGSANDLARLEVALKAATAALCSVLASWVITQGIAV